jgi:tripartite-type tricarboxylate transporter receptor subunit TctC
VARLNGEANRALAAPAVREKLTALGVEVVAGSSERFAEHIRKETAKWAEVVKRAGVKVD